MVQPSIPIVYPFDRTYEGLKLLELVGVLHKPPAFDRTYEGLKPGFLRRRSWRPKAFDRTYEGLKLLAGLPLLAFVFCF